MFTDDGGCCMKVKIVSGRNIPSYVSGVVPAANIICAVKQQTFQSPSVVSHTPIWNYVAEFKDANLKKDLLTFIIRDADQILGSHQVPVKNITVGIINTQILKVQDSKSPCSISFLLLADAKTTLNKKRLLERTKKFKDTVLSRFGSDPDLANTQKSTLTSGSGEALDQSLKSVYSKGLRRCHSNVNERTRPNKTPLSRHEYVNCPKLRPCGELEGTAPNIKNTEYTPKKMLLVLVQGQNLGTSQSDILSVNVGGVDCTDHIQHCTAEKLLVRVPRGTALSPVSVVTKSGGIGQQHAKVKVTYESSSSSDELKSLRRCETRSRDSREGSRDISSVEETVFCGSPTGSTSNAKQFGRIRITNSSLRKSTVDCNSGGSSDSGSDGLCVNARSPLRASLPPQRRRSSSSFSSDKSSLEPDSSSSVSRESPSTTLNITRPNSAPHVPSSRPSLAPQLPPCIPCTIPQVVKLRPTASAREKLVILSPDQSSDIIAPPHHFSEGSSPQTPHHFSEGSSPHTSLHLSGRSSPQTSHCRVGSELYSLTKTELVQEILNLRKTVSSLAMTVQTLTRS